MPCLPDNRDSTVGEPDQHAGHGQEVKNPMPDRSNLQDGNPSFEGKEHLDEGSGNADQQD
jgi:hypothetical protein